MWFAEVRRLGDDGMKDDWQRLGGPYKSQERAKAECKKEFNGCAHNWRRLEFRTVADDERGTVYQLCMPPHGWKLRWVDSRQASVMHNANVTGLAPAQETTK